MLRNLLIVSTFAFFSSILTGCHLYVEDDDGARSGGTTFCDSTGCYTCDDWGCYPSGGGAEPGWDCTSNNDCAAGCFCNGDSLCEEAGFCASDADCPTGFECDGRSSCVPEGSDQRCEEDANCPSGSYCDEFNGTCVGSPGCRDDEQCGMGFECDERNTCVPLPCTDDGMCQEGCYCNEDRGECIETTTCDANGGCPSPLVCDEDRNTCVPQPQGPTCQSEVDCDAAAPVCPAGSTPAIENGCYTGTCMLKTDCPDGAPFACSDLNGDENACSDNASCEAVYKGVNCTSPDGTECTSGSANCSCESFEYDYCGDL